jgi:hypothetical protein
MISLSDTQLKAVMAAASSLVPERRDTFLQRIAAMLRRGRFTDSDVADLAQLALTGLAQHQPAEDRKQSHIDGSLFKPVSIRV